MAPDQMPLVPTRREWPDTWPGVVGYFLVHPRTWCLLIAFAMSWQCFGLKEFYYRHHAPRLEEEAIAATAHH